MTRVGQRACQKVLNGPSSLVETEIRRCEIDTREKKANLRFYVYWYKSVFFDAEIYQYRRIPNLFISAHIAVDVAFPTIASSASTELCSIQLLSVFIRTWPGPSPWDNLCITATYSHLKITTIT